MLTEQFVASIAAPTKPNTGVTKDAGIFLHEFQPLAAQRYVFKKSASPPSGLAVSNSHIFAAQADKAVVHVYSREKGNQEAIVPFPERIHSIALACKATVLLLGAESGRILAWEVRAYFDNGYEAKANSDQDLLWPPGIDFYIASSAGYVHRRGPDLEFLSIRLRRLYDPRMEPPIDSVILPRYVTYPLAYPLDSPRTDYTLGLWSQFDYSKHCCFCVPR
jgi:hypothetical protein